MIRNMFNGSVFFNIFSTPTVFTSLFDTFVTCGFQFRCLFRFMPKKLKLSTNSISVPVIFIVGRPYNTFLLRHMKQHGFGFL